MIYREVDSGWVVITQPAHALVSGRLAALWGNEQFVEPYPRDAVVLATTIHDIGWSPWDANPPLHPDGRPVNFLETTLEDTHAVWERGVAQATLYNPYSALMVSMHATLVYTRRRARWTDPPEKRPELDKRLRKLEQYQAETRSRLQHHPLYAKAVDPVRVHANYRILRSCDLLSLEICTRALSDGMIEDVPADSPDKRITINYKPCDVYTLALDPYPFSVPEVVVQVEARLLDKHTFPDNGTFQATLASAAWQVFEFRFVRA
jgi:hypothetical protein